MLVVYLYTIIYDGCSTSQVVGFGISEPSTVGLWEVPNFQATKRTKVRWLKISFFSRDFANYFPPTKMKMEALNDFSLGKDTHHRNHWLGSALIFGGVFTEFFDEFKASKDEAKVEDDVF